MLPDGACAQAAVSVGDESAVAVTRQEQVPILEPGGELAAASLLAVASCSREELGMSIATLSWAISDEPGADQRVDATLYRTGFESERFDVLWVLSSDTLRTYSMDEATRRAAVEVTGLSPGANYYWRVLTLTPDGWVPSETARLPAAVCPVDARPPVRALPRDTLLRRGENEGPPTPWSR